MHSRAYIYKVLEELSDRDNATEDAEDSFLMSIYHHIRELPSPEREEAFVDLLIQCEEVPSQKKKSPLAA
jgi:hypothetical protein